MPSSSTGVRRAAAPSRRPVAVARSGTADGGEQAHVVAEPRTAPPHRVADHRGAPHPQRVVDRRAAAGHRRRVALGQDAHQRRRDGAQPSTVGRDHDHVVALIGLRVGHRHPGEHRRERSRRPSPRRLCRPAASAAASSIGRTSTATPAATRAGADHRPRSPARAPRSTRPAGWRRRRRPRRGRPRRSSIRTRSSGRTPPGSSGACTPASQTPSSSRRPRAGRASRRSRAASRACSSGLAIEPTAPRRVAPQPGGRRSPAGAPASVSLLTGVLEVADRAELRPAGRPGAGRAGPAAR